MKIITFQGGLGNQMFQYHFYLWLKKRTKQSIYGYYPKKGLRSHNGLEIEKVFTNIELPKSSTWSTLNCKIIKLLTRFKLSKISRVNQLSLNSTLFEDYWQNLLYISDFEFRFDLLSVKSDYKNSEVLDKMINEESVSIHVRRGDYITEKYKKIYGEVCGIEYYRKAIEIANQQLAQPSFFVFSDDIDWAKKNLNLKNVVYIDWNLGERSFIDMALMSYCKFNVIANSTFSWWAAKINNNPQKLIISPKRWFGSNEIDEPLIFPDEWIRI